MHGAWRRTGRRVGADVDTAAARATGTCGSEANVRVRVCAHASARELASVRCLGA